jgi:hypothetical protein
MEDRLRLVIGFRGVGERLRELIDLLLELFDRFLLWERRLGDTDRFVLTDERRLLTGDRFLDTERRLGDIELLSLSLLSRRGVRDRFLFGVGERRRAPLLNAGDIERSFLRETLRSRFLESFLRYLSLPIGSGLL